MTLFINLKETFYPMLFAFKKKKDLKDFPYSKMVI